MISEGSCDWGNDANNSALFFHYFILFILYFMLLYFTTLDQINAGFLSRRDFFKNIKYLNVQKPLTGSV